VSERPEIPAPEAADAICATRLMKAAADGQAGAAEQLLPLVYQQLRSMAAARMRGEKKGHTLQATALVHEAYLRLVGDDSGGWANRGQFFRAAAEAMRRILIEHARRRGRLKRGGDQRRQPLDVLDLASDADTDNILELDAATTRLQERDARAAEIVHLRFYGGLSVEEAAAALGLSERTVKREWTFARAWLYGELSAGDRDEFSRRG